MPVLDSSYRVPTTSPDITRQNRDRGSFWESVAPHVNQTSTCSLSEGDETSVSENECDGFWGNCADDESRLDGQHRQWYASPSEAAPKKVPVRVTDLQAFVPDTSFRASEPRAKKRVTRDRQISKSEQKRSSKGRIVHAVPVGEEWKHPFKIPQAVEVEHVASENLPKQSLQSQYTNQYRYKHEVDRGAPLKARLERLGYSDATRKLYALATDEILVPDKKEMPLTKKMTAGTLEETAYQNTRAEKQSAGASFKSGVSLAAPFYPDLATPKAKLQFGAPKTDQGFSDVMSGKATPIKDEAVEHVVQQNPEVPESKEDFPDEDTTDFRAVPVAVANNEALRFPQSDFCVDLSQGQPTIRRQDQADAVLNALHEKGACLKIPLPSGFSLRVPAPAGKMLNYGLPSFTNADSKVALQDVRKHVEGENQRQELAGKELVDDATLGALRQRPSLVLKQKQHADLLLARPMHEASNIGQVEALHFASGTVDNVMEKRMNYVKLDENEVVQTEALPAKLDYSTLKQKVAESLLEKLDDPVNAPKNLDKLGNAHECMRQYLKDHKMDQTAQNLAQEWWLHHEERCQEVQHGQHPYQMSRQYFELAEQYATLLREYKATRSQSEKEHSCVLKCRASLRFMTLNFKRYVAKLQYTQKELASAKSVDPEDFRKLQLQKDDLERRFKSMRQLSHNLHNTLREKKKEKNTLEQVLVREVQGLQLKRSGKPKAGDAAFPNYQGVNLQIAVSKKKPVQLAKGLTLTKKMAGHAGAVSSISISTSRPVAVSVGSDGKWFMWDTSTMAKPILEGAGHKGAIHKCEFHPTGNYFVTGGMDKVVNLWHAGDGKLEVQMNHSDSVTSLSFHSCGDFLLTGAENGGLALWDMKSNRCRTNFKRWMNADYGHAGAIANCQILTNSNAGMTAGEDGRILLWDLRTATLFGLGTSRNTETKERLKKGFVRHRESNHALLDLSSPIKNAKVASNGHVMATTLRNDSEISLWDIRKLGTSICVGHYAPDMICDFNFDPSCHVVAMGMDNGSVCIWDLASGGTAVYAAHSASVICVEWGAWAEHALSGDEQGNIFLWS